MHVKAGQFYRHYKGGLYEVIGVTNEQPLNKAKNIGSAMHTETGEEIAIWKNEDGSLSTVTGEELVIYIKNGDRESWLKPLKMFTEKINQEVFRFTLL